MQFKDKVVLVTGGANGIGRSVVRKFQDQGARIAIWDLADEAGNELAAEIKDQGGTASYRHVNVTQSEDVDQAGRIRIAARDYNGCRLNTDEIREVMALARHGYAEVGDEDE